MQKNSSSQGMKFKIISCSIVAALIFIIVVTIYNAVPKEPNGSPVKKPGMSQEPKEEHNSQGTEIELAVIRKIDYDNKEMMIYDLNTEDELVMKYNGGTEFINRFGQTSLDMQFMVGEIINLYYELDTSVINRCIASTKAWEYKEVVSYTLDKESKEIKIGETRYKYTNNLLVVNNNQESDLNHLHEKDKLMMKGVGEVVYSISVMKGHGYVKLTNYSAFLGGSLEIGYQTFLKVEEDMQITVREGDYRITFQKGDIVAVKYIHVNRDKTTTVDMSEYIAESPKMSEIVFRIAPEGADLFIEGVETEYEYEHPIQLEYGEYEIEVRLPGYEIYTGMLTVSNEKQEVLIQLVSQDAIKKTPSPDIIVEDTDPNEDTEQSANPSLPPQNTQRPDVTREPSQGMGEVDEAHTITITAPVGAEVYLGDTYKGTIPVSFTKIIGMHRITLKMEGFQSKSYSIEVLNDNSDATFSFPALLAE